MTSKVKYFYDTEFIDNGETIELLSIGIVAEDGREYYAVVKDIYLMDAAWNKSTYEYLQALDGPVANPRRTRMI